MARPSRSPVRARAKPSPHSRAQSTHRSGPPRANPTAEPKERTPLGTVALPVIVLAMCAAAALVRGLWMRTVYGHYCGPNSGNNFSLAPVDAVDALCLQHDYCIEKSVELAYGAGTRVPLRSHKVPKFGCMIAECDRQFVELIDEPRMLPQPPLRHSRFAGMFAAVFDDASSDMCSQHWGIAYAWCRLFVRLARAYHVSKITEFVEAVRGSWTAFSDIPACSRLLAASSGDGFTLQQFMRRSHR